MRNGFIVFIALVVAVAAGFWFTGFWNDGNVSAPTESTSGTPAKSISDAPPTISDPVDLSNPPPVIHVMSAVNAPAPIGVNEPAIRGRVVDEFDAPVENAAVTIYEADRGPYRAFTDSSGGFAIGDLVANRKYMVRAEKAHYNEAVDEDVVAGTDDVVLVLIYTSTATGRVVDESGQPVTRFELVYLKRVIDDDVLWKEIVRSGATSWQAFEHPEGRYEVADVGSSAPFSLGARAAGFEAAVTVTPAAPPGQQITVSDIVLKIEARIEGRVLSPKRALVPLANVHLGPDTEGPIIGRTDETGSFTLSGLGDAPIELTADHDAYLPATIRAFPSRGRVQSVEIVLGQGGALVGRVTRGNQAAAGQTVLVVRRTEPRIQKQTITDENGRYRIEGLGTGTLVVLSKYALPGGGGSPLRIQSQVNIVSGAEATLNFDFPDALGTLEGTITASGRPVAFAEIQGTVDTTQGQTTFLTGTGDDGVYRVENIIPGDAWVTVFARELQRTVTTKLREGETTRLDVDFDEAAILSGAVTNIAAGEAGQVLAIFGHDAVEVSTAEEILHLESIKAGESDIFENGQFVINGLEPGDYTLVALVFRVDADTGDDAISTIRVGTTKTTLPESGDATVTLTLSP